MADASPICRGKNLTVETVMAFLNAMPLTPMKKAAFHNAAEVKLKGWTQTHSQIARQLALYYEEDGVCYPRFTHRVTYPDVIKYVTNWAMLYCVPNPYTPSLESNNNKITNIYAFVKNKAQNGITSFDEACKAILGIELNNTDKVRVYLNNFTDLIISDDSMTINANLIIPEMPDIYPEVTFESNKQFFDYFSVRLCTDDGLFRQRKNSLPLQQIVYGAPGTGKSHSINEATAGEDVIRTTFHPDTDYSTFVGAYKPTTKSIPVTTVIGTQAVAVKDLEGQRMFEDKIVYEFVPQAFLQAYVAAWRKFAEAGNSEPRRQYLVIEEINRGNCAQIFGDLFQLLDRGESGFSEYPIEADADMKRQLRKSFSGLAITQREEINGLFGGRDVVREVLEGDILLLPGNLYIWATMNTSDQSLFPIDSAFKRRWDWRYVPISDAAKGWTIAAGGSRYDWWSFVERINKKIGDTTNSEDKKLGYFFCKAADGVISAETFVGKVVFYLWNDVFKDYEFADSIFDDSQGRKLTFDRFYQPSGAVEEETVALFLRNLGVSQISDFSKDEEGEDDSSVSGGNDSTANGRNYDRYTVNGGAECGKNRLGVECVKEFVKLYPHATAQEVFETWRPMNTLVSHFIETKEIYDARTDRSTGRSDAIICADGDPVYVVHNGFADSNGKADGLMVWINGKKWGITVRKIEK